MLSLIYPYLFLNSDTIVYRLSVASSLNQEIPSNLSAITLSFHDFSIDFLFFLLVTHKFR